MLKVGVLGAGHLGKIHLKLLQQSSKYQLVGFYDPSEENAKKVAEEFGYTSYNLIDELIEAVDVVDIVTPTLSHFDCAKEAILAGKHVFIEKPITKTVEDAETLTQGPIGQELTENTINDAGVRIIAWTYTGFRRLTNSKKPVKSVADLQGLVIRVPKNEIMIDTYKSWGISPTPMAWSETFAGLQTKVVDGQDNPYTTINAMKFYEVQKYVTNIRYIFSIEPLIIKKSSLTIWSVR